MSTGNRPDSVAFIFEGQSNASRALQLQVLTQLAGKGACLGDQRGGSSIKEWTGTTPPYARTATYDHLRAKLAGVTCDVICVISVRGESEADTAEDTAAFTARYDAFLGWLAEDFAASTVKLVLSLPWDTDSGGYGAGGRGDTIRAAMIARAAADPTNIVTVETSDLTRADTVHVDTAQIPTLATRLLAAVTALGL